MSSTLRYFADEGLPAPCDLEDHGYCFDEAKQEWALCAATN